MVHQPADGGALLGHGDEELAGLAVLVEADGEVALVAGDVELVGEGVAGVGEAAAQGLLDDDLDGGRDGRGVGLLGVAIPRVHPRVAVSRCTRWGRN
jgi:hypothetical protein